MFPINLVLSECGQFALCDMHCELLSAPMRSTTIRRYLGGSQSMLYRMPTVSYFYDYTCRKQRSLRQEPFIMILLTMSSFLRKIHLFEMLQGLPSENSPMKARIICVRFSSHARNAVHPPPRPFPSDPV